MSDKEPKPQKERSEASKRMEEFLKSIGAKDKTLERMGKSALSLNRKVKALTFLFLLLTIYSKAQVYSFDAYLSDENRSQLNSDVWHVEELILEPINITVVNLNDTAFLNLSRIRSNSNGKKNVITEVWGCSRKKGMSSNSENKGVTKSILVCSYISGNNNYSYQGKSEVHIETKENSIISLPWYFNSGSKNSTGRLRYVRID